MKKLLKMFLTLTLVVTATFGTACDRVLNFIIHSSEESSSISSEKQSEHSEDSYVRESPFESSSEESSSEEDSLDSSNSSNSSDSSNASDSSGETPPPERVELRREIDDIGHEIIYYTNGEYVDNGRVVELDFSSPPPQTQYGYSYFSEQEDGEGLQAFYEDLYELSTQFHTSSTTITESNGIVGSVPFKEYGLTRNQAYAVWSVFRMENPAFYWIDNSVRATEEELKLLCYEEYYEGEVRSGVWESVQEFALDCDRYLNGKTSKTERLLTIFEYVVDNVEYAYKEDGKTPETEVWAHNVVGGALYNKGVCETYAKTLDYFCGLFGLECITVAGDSVQGVNREAHGWNLIKVDGEWYCADPTWADKKYYNGSLIVNREWFGTEFTEFSKTHIPYTPNEDWEENFLSTYQVALPEISEKELSPTILSENGGEKILYNSVDEALQNMKKEDSRYEIILYPQTSVGIKDGLQVYPYGAEFTGQLPKVKELTISSSLTLLNEKEGIYFLPMLTAESEIQLVGDVVLRELRFYTPTLDINRYTLTTRGWNVYLQVDDLILGDGNSLLVVETEYETKVDAVALAKAEIMDGELFFADGGEMEEICLIGGSIRLWSEEDWTVETLRAFDTSRNMWICGASNATKVLVKNVYGKDAWGQLVNFNIQFGDVKEYPNLTVENADCNIELFLVGHVTSVTTDLAGNVVSTFEKEANPEDLTMPIVNIGNIPMHALRVLYSLKGVGVEKTDLYEKAENGDVYLKK